MAQEIADSKLIDTWSSDGLKVKPDISKIIEGWQLGEQPPHEYMNWLQNTFGSKLNHILKNGVASWNNTTQYLAGSSVQHNGNIWLCKATNTNSEPTDVNANWKRIITVESLNTVLNGYVALTGNQTIAGVKTFSSSPIVPTPTDGTQVANKAYVDTKQANLGYIPVQQGTGIGQLGNTVKIGWSPEHRVKVTVDVTDIGNIVTDIDGTITGVKTFSSSPIVPTPTTNTQAANKAYVDSNITPPYNPTPIIATGTATFNATTNNISLTGIGVGVEVGDVIQISGADDAKNNSEFTVEVITDANNIIVNQAHANKGTTKNVAARASDTGVTVKLLAKWYNAPIGLGQDWVIVTTSRTTLTHYPNNTKRTILVTVTQNTTGGALQLTVNSERFFYDVGASGNTITSTMEVNAGEIYSASIPGSNFIWRERR